MIIRFILLVLLVLSTGATILISRIGVLNANPHALCPYSFICFGIPTLRGFFTSNPFIISSVVGLIILISTLFLGRLFCGWLCPLGAIQEVLHKLTNGKIKGKAKPLISDKCHNRLKYFKYIVLLINIAFAYYLIQALYMNGCPVIALANIGNYLLISGIVIFIILTLSLFIERIWCRYFCPYGALMSLVMKIGNVLKIPRLMLKINKEKCVTCELCSSNCPMQIDVDKNSKVIDSECILCQRCKYKCPLNGIDCEFCKEQTTNEKS